MMKFISLILLIVLFVLFNSRSYSEDALTIKQQIDRITEEIKDLNKAVFNNQFESDKFNSKENEKDSERFTSIDIRIFDLEKDIKNLTLQIEEILFRFEDLSKNIDNLQIDLIKKIEKVSEKSKIINETSNTINNDEKKSSRLKEKNTLGKIIISSDNNSTTNNENTTNNSDVLEDDDKSDTKDLNPEELLQFALDQMMKKNYDKSKKILEGFIKNFSDNQLSGSAHFWLGKIYLFETDYRKAAIVFGEGVQKFPESIKAPEMYYELAKSLKELNKNSEACKTLTLLDKNYKNSKFVKDPEKIKTDLSCENN